MTLAAKVAQTAALDTTAHGELSLHVADSNTLQVKIIYTQSKYPEARACRNQKAVAIHEKLLGNHPMTAVSRASKTWPSRCSATEAMKARSIPSVP